MNHQDARSPSSDQEHEHENKTGNENDTNRDKAENATATTQTVRIAAVNMFGLCLTIALTLQARSQLMLGKLKNDVASCSELLAK